MVNDEELGYVFPCNGTLPDLSLEIGGYEAKIPGVLMNGGVADGESMLPFLCLFVPSHLLCTNRIVHS